jgi:DNA-binding MarR family transcriptional regulator
MLKIHIGEKPNYSMMDKMLNIRDFDILHILFSEEKMRFKDFEDAQMMAKSTLSKHLNELRRSRLIKKTFDETLNCDVYVITPKGKKAYTNKTPPVPPRVRISDLKDF